MVIVLNRHGIVRNDRVAVVLPNGLEAAAAFISIASCATYAPLNPAYGPDEFDFYLSDLNAKALVVLAGQSSPAREVAAARKIQIFELTPISTAKEFFKLHAVGNTPSFPAPEAMGLAQPGDAALVLHTSGTTSRPKIVVLTQSNICTSAQNIAGFLGLGAQDRCLNVMPLFHIHGLIGALLSSLSSGASVFCTTGFSATEFFSQLRESAASWYTAVPTMHQAVLAQAAGAREIIAAHPLRFIRSSSSALPPKVWAELEKTFNAPVIEAYGMTEASHQMASNPLPPGKRKPGSVGIPAGPEVAVINDMAEILPPTVAGEIAIRGPNVTAGYENNPAANEKAFTGQGWFRTGDQGYFDAEGYLFISGRLKEIINRGGEKFSPREIDEVLLDHPSVAQALTFAMPHLTLGEDVAAAVVLRKGSTTTEGDIRRFAAERLAQFKVPRRVLILKEIPKGPTGKLQRVGLAQRLGVTADEPAAIARSEYVAPRTSLEQTLSALWSDVLQLESIGMNDNFFLLGGDSLSATRLLVRIRELLEVTIPIPTFFGEPTIAAGSKYISQHSSHPVGALEEMFDEIQEMSEEEAQHLYSKESIQ
jgi:acyl-CoA synthetase (AMP-forming)/AMP-acid ligase II/acyl carrier protein